VASARRAGEAFLAGRTRILAALKGFTAAPFGPGEAARRAQQLLRFLALVPVEYERGVDDRTVTKDFEIEEAVTFQEGAQAAFLDLESALSKRDPEAAERADRGLGTLQAFVVRAQRTPGDASTADEVEQAADETDEALRGAMPEAWLEPTDESDYDLIALTLDRMEASAGAGQYQQAEQARLEAYAFFEFGPERRLQAFDATLATTIEGVFWFGADGEEGLARLIADHAPLRELKAARRVLDERLGDAAATLGDSASRATVVTNAAILVFREGLEAVLILAAITASFVGARRRMRRPVLVGAGLGLLASIVTWVLAQTLLTSLAQYGERLEAIVGLVAIAVLLLITNWFFHRVYWSEWIGKFHRRRRGLEKLEGGRLSFISAQVVGLVLLGLTSIYREGFETVLFLQSLQLSAGTVAVLEGAALGLALTFAVGAAIFVLERKLPYKKMLVVTGVMIGFVLVVMVGQTARTMQGAGWLSITPIEIDIPSWASLWFGVFPTVETLAAQAGAAIFVIGSYFLAQELKVKRPAKRAARSEPRRFAVEDRAPAAPVSGESRVEAGVAAE
jgi:high-affinity iron transporter